MKSFRLYLKEPPPTPPVLASDLRPELRNDLRNSFQLEVIRTTRMTRYLMLGFAAAIVALGSPPRVRVVNGEPPIEVHVGEAFAGPTRLALDERDERAGLGSITVPIESDVGRLGQLIVYPDAGSLFLEDDLVLMELLATQAARADERRG